MWYLKFLLSELKLTKYSNLADTHICFITLLFRRVWCGKSCCIKFMVGQSMMYHIPWQHSVVWQGIVWKVKCPPYIHLITWHLESNSPVFIIVTALAPCISRRTGTGYCAARPFGQWAVTAIRRSTGRSLSSFSHSLLSLSQSLPYSLFFFM